MYFHRHKQYFLVRRLFSSFSRGEYFLKHSSSFTENHLWWSIFCNKVSSFFLRLQLCKREALIQILSCELCGFFRNTFFLNAVFYRIPVNSYFRNLIAADISVRSESPPLRSSFGEKPEGYVNFIPLLRHRHPLPSIKLNVFLNSINPCSVKSQFQKKMIKWMKLLNHLSRPLYLLKTIPTSSFYLI